MNENNKSNGIYAEFIAKTILEYLGYKIKSISSNDGVDIKLESYLNIEVKSAQYVVGIKRKNKGTFKINEVDIKRSDMVMFFIKGVDKSGLIRFVNTDDLSKHLIENNRKFNDYGYLSLTINSMLELESININFK